jgi:hypothetical protein
MPYQQWEFTGGNFETAYVIKNNIKISTIKLKGKRSIL